MQNGGKEILSIEWRKLSWTEYYVCLEADFISNELRHLTEEIPKKVVQGWNSNTQYLIWRPGLYRANQIKMRSLGWSWIQYNWSFRKDRSYDIGTHKKRKPCKHVKWLSENQIKKLE